MSLIMVAQTTFRYGNFIYKLYDEAEPYAWLSAPVGQIPSDIIIPSSIPMGGKDYAVTGICSNAFSKPTEYSISSITLPPTVTYFGSMAFYNVKSCDVYISSMESWLKSTFKQDGNPLRGKLYLNGELVKAFSAPSDITSIPDYAFANCTSLLKARIGKNITSIGKSSFRDCTSLNFVYIPGNVNVLGDYAFFGCRSLTSLTIASGLTELGEYAFSRCVALTSITIPSSVQTIGKGCFSKCSGVKSLSLAEGLAFIGEEAFWCCNFSSVSLPRTVTEIGKWAFNGTALTEFTLPAGQTVTFGEAALGMCKSLKSVYLYGDVSEISPKMFYGCSELQTIYIPASASIIQIDAFSGCTKLSRIEIPNLRNWFDKVNMPRKEYYTGNIYAYCRYYYNFRDCEYSLYVNGEEINDLTVPDGVTKINAGLFCGNKGLRSVNLCGVSEVEIEAFTNCSNLVSLTLDDTLTKIGELESPSTFTSAFKCLNLTDIYYKTLAPVKLSSNLFNEEVKQNATLHIIPDAMEKICLTSPWLYFVNIVADITDSGINEVKAMDGEMICDVYSTTGSLVRGGVKMAEWNDGLTPGIYIVRLTDGSVRKVATR